MRQCNQQINEKRDTKNVSPVITLRHGWSVAVVLAMLLLPGLTGAQDRVVILLSDNTRTHIREGTIVDWKGGEMQMEYGGQINTIKNDRIVSVETEWSGDYLMARDFINRQQYAAAVTPLQNAIDAEERTWVRRMFLAQQTRLCHLLGERRASAEMFMLLIQDDPDTRDFAVIPLMWDNRPLEAPLVEFAKKLQASSILPLQLLGASWLLTSTERTSAMQKLETLSRDLDSRIAHLASAQLWRTKVQEVDAVQLGRWERQIERMPRDLRSGPLLVLGQAQQRLGKTQEAILSWMQAPILHSEQYSAAAGGLQLSATALQNGGQTLEAERLWNELADRFPETPWAIEARAALARIRPVEPKSKGQ